MLHLYLRQTLYESVCVYSSSSDNIKDCQFIDKDRMKTKFTFRNANRSAVLWALLFAVVIFVSPTVTISADDTAAQIDNTTEALSEWVEIQKNISKEKRDLAVAKETLNERIELVEREITSLQAKVTEAEASIADADKKRAEMIDQNEKLKQASESLEKILVTLESETKTLLKRLPDPIRERVKPLSQRMPDGTGKNKMTMSDRFSNVVGILNEVDKFNREISVTSEVRELSDGTSVEVTALYIGIGHGYYASSNGNVAGIGVPTENGWQWKQANESAAAISDAIAILKNEKVAEFVKLPVEIK